ncbi:MAG: UDP-3-O-(3-hydroxymyristoyl)glucosamine N-acyltransferase [Anoxybacillus gonensis]|nr:UDP-3-O-(3-hydroxymyristoyl)glucosamine N-acyltransferase [Anoxybacillus gonensis]
MFTVREIASLVNGIVEGDENIQLEGISLIDDASPSHFTYARTENDIKKISKTNAKVVIVPPLLSLPEGKTYIKVPCSPEEVLPIILERLSEQACLERVETSIHHTVKISQNCSIGKGVYIGKNTIIHPNTVIDDGVFIGDECIIFPNVYIGRSVHISNRVVIHAGAVIGADSFEFISNGRAYEKLKNLGKVVVEDDVEIGANTTIDRGTIGNTIIGRGAKIDNLVQIGHEVKVGKHCIIAAQVGIAGWAEIGDYTTIYGQSGVVGNVVVGKRVVVMAKSLVTKHIPDGSIVSGNPAMNHREQLKMNAFIKRSYRHS